MFNELLKNVMNLGIITEDDVKRLTAIELMLLIIERINGLLLHVNNVDGKLDTLLEDVNKITIEELNKWTQDGTFDSLINQTGLKKVNARLDNVDKIQAQTNAQLSHLNNSKAEVAYVDNKITTLANATPDRALANVDELNREYPNGHNFNKVVASDGHIYTWDSSLNQWKDTGIQYQSTGIANKSITQLHLGDYSSRAFKYEESIFGYGFSEILNLNFSIGALDSDGTIANNQWNIVSDFFTVKDVITIKPIKSVSFKIARYDSEKRFINLEGAFTTEREFENDANYYRISLSDSSEVTDINSLINKVVIGVGKTNVIKEIKESVDVVTEKIISSPNLLNPLKMTRGTMVDNQGIATINDLVPSESTTWFVSEIIDYNDIKGLELVATTRVKCFYYKDNILQASAGSQWNSVLNLSEMTTLNTSDYDKVRFEMELWDSESSFLGEKSKYNGFEPYGNKLVDDVLEYKINQLEKDERKIYLPNTLYCLKGENVILPYRSFVSASDNSFKLKSTADDGKYKLFKDKYVKKITENDGDWFYLHDAISDKLLDSKYTYFKYAVPENKVISDKKNIMILGDSFIQAGVIGDDFKQAMDGYGYNLNYLGYDTTSNGTKLMGYGGYRAWDFINNPTNLRPEFPSNPFWNPITNQVDFKYFIENKMNETTLDYVVLHLGVNDKLTDSLSGEDGNNEIVNRIVTLVNYIHASYPKCKIFVDGLVILSKDNEFANFRMYADDIFDYNYKLEQALSALDNVFYVPVIATFNSDYAYEYEMVQAYKDSDEHYKVVKEWLHPSTVGYHMIADQLIPAFIYNI